VIGAARAATRFARLPLKSRKKSVRRKKNSPKVKQTVLVLFLLAATAARPQSASEMLRLEQSAEAMGSAYSIAVYGYDRQKMEAAVEAAFDEVRQLDSMLSNYKPDSEWSAVNSEAAQHPVAVSPELFHLLAACQDYSRESEGAFDELTPAHRLRAGDRVRILEGPFENCLGRLVAASDQERVFILFEMLGRTVRAEVSAAAIEAA